MKISLKRGLAGVLAAAIAYSPVYAANIPYLTGIVPAGEMQATLNGVIQSINNNITPNSMAAFGNYRNFLDNGQHLVAQRGTAAATGGTTSGALYPNSDRWAVDTNVTSGAGYSQVVTSGPTPPVGFVNTMNVYRNSGVLTQPVCVMQEVPTSDATQLAGQQVTFSFYAAGLANLVADNGGVINAYIMYGTGSDQGLGTFTASPAITPAWTGINSSITAAFTLSTSFSRYSLSGTLPTTVTEINVAICFTPTAAAVAGATDGFSFTGAQLEQGAAASYFEMRPLTMETQKAQRYYYRIAELAAGVVQSTVGTAQGTTTTCTTYFPFPVQMRAAPTYTNTLTASTFKIVSASQAATALGTPFSATLTANGINGASINFTTTGMTAKDSCFLVGAGGGGALAWTADF
jgi:hypothetical protein